MPTLKSHRYLWFLTILLVTGSTAWSEVVARHGKGRLEKGEGGLVLTLAGTPYEMGFQHGKLVGDLVKHNLKAINNNQTALSQTIEYKAYLTMRPLMHMMLRRHIPKRFAEEMRGLADAVGVSYSEIEAVNLFPAAFHCSGMALMGKATHDGSLYHVRILDYMTKLGFQDASLILVHEPEGLHRWINVGFAGIVGSVTGMNDQQITIGEMGGKGLFYWNGVPMTMLIRDALERASTLDEAVRIFRKSPRTCEYYYVISDAKIPDARGIWATSRDFEAVKPGQTYGFVTVEKPGRGAAGKKSFGKDFRIDVTKHSILFRDQKGEVEGFIGRPPKDTVILSGHDRYQHFTRRLAPAYGKVDEKVLQKMIRRPVSMKSNLHNAIFHPATLEVWVAVAASDGSPACNQTYYRYSLAPKAGNTQETPPAVKSLRNRAVPTTPKSTKR